MSSIISLRTPDLDWEVLVRSVERTGVPVWLELDGVLQGVLLAPTEVHRLLGHALQAHPTPAPLNVPEQARSEENT